MHRSVRRVVIEVNANPLLDFVCPIFQFKCIFSSIIQLTFMLWRCTMLPTQILAQVVLEHFTIIPQLLGDQDQSRMRFPQDSKVVVEKRETTLVDRLSPFFFCKPLLTRLLKDCRSALKPQLNSMLIERSPAMQMSITRHSVYALVSCLSICIFPQLQQDLWALHLTVASSHLLLPHFYCTTLFCVPFSFTHFLTHSSHSSPSCCVSVSHSLVTLLVSCFPFTTCLLPSLCRPTLCCRVQVVDWLADIW